MKIIYSEINKVRHNYLLVLPLLFNFYFIYSIYSDSILESINFPGYLFSCTLLMLTTYGTFFLTFISSFLMHNEYLWNTLSHMTRKLSLSKIYLVKQLMVVIFTFFLLVFSTTYIFFICILNDSLIKFNFHHGVVQLLVVFLYLIMVGSYSLLLTLITKSCILGAIIPSLLPFTEPILYSFLSNSQLKWFPLYNFRSIFYRTFDNLKIGSMFIVPSSDYPPVIFSLIYIIVFTTAPLVLGLIYFNKNGIRD